jgi:hypothetical protein
LPTERRARQQRFLLTLAANGQNRRKNQEYICWGWVERRYPASTFSKAADWLVFRYAAIRNSFENGQEAKSPLSATALPGSVIENSKAAVGNAGPPLSRSVSTFFRWRAERDDGEHSGS